MRISTLIAVSLTVLATAQHVCKSPDIIKGFFGAILGNHPSIYSMIQGLLNNQNEHGNFGSIVFTQWNNRDVAVKFQKVNSVNQRPVAGLPARHYELALAEASHLDVVSRKNLNNVGNVKPEFFACEKGVINGNHQHLYVIIVMDKLDNNFERVHNNLMMTDLRDTLDDPVKRLKIYLRMARSLQAIHDSGRVHNDIKPANVVAKRDLSAVKWIDYGLIAIAGQHSRVRGSPLFYDKRKWKIFRANKTLFFRGRYVDENQKPADIWAFGLTIYQIECKLANAQDRTLAPGDENINQSFQNNIDAILNVNAVYAHDNPHCFQASGIHVPTDSGNRSIVDILREMLALNRSQRNITALEIARRLMRIIHNNDPHFSETDDIGETPARDPGPAVERADNEVNQDPLLRIELGGPLMPINEWEENIEEEGEKLPLPIEYDGYGEKIHI